ncbi:hypothetical protein MLD38_020607 [Melastoma candidum]|nr:hypothetical protein MLD38_020607 [Melastoma candidum]
MSSAATSHSKTSTGDKLFEPTSSSTSLDHSRSPDNNGAVPCFQDLPSSAPWSADPTSASPTLKSGSPATPRYHLDLQENQPVDYAASEAFISGDLQPTTTSDSSDFQRKSHFQQR